MTTAPATADLGDLVRDLALANRMLTQEGVLDAFGHASVRHPEDPGRFLISVSKAPINVRAEDIIVCDLDARPVEPTDRRVYSEGVIHSEIYRARPDVNSVCHHHAAAIMPFCLSRERLVPVNQLGAVIGEEAPFWDSQDEFGDTNLLLVRPEEGASLARALGPHWVVLMRRHGATVVGRSLKEMFFRAVHSTANAGVQLAARALGPVESLTPGEIALASRLRPDPIERQWLYSLTRRIEAVGPERA
ncbi:class II aldolase/adducin family protein [Ancylobacter mangrovi]|uniref:class II aldolase/adducin family protein n=1 Tax=Ancylobacter mangrovi TaxID=2972472 RepID=UPI002162EEEA|nr:class II aldolase/adducin family protein [Ancylobacter mangrovi]MCS0503733.1 class II aldolase/adducin family protein [Ancylobacter mangrovi]